MSFKRSVMGEGIPALAANNIVGDWVTQAGAGTTQAGATQLWADTTNLTTSSGQTAFVLPTAAQGVQVGDSCTLYNSSATTALVYPGGTESANASASAISVAQNTCLFLKRVSATNWGYGGNGTPIALVGTPSVVTNVNGTAVLTFVTSPASYASADLGTASGVYDSSAADYNGAGPALALTTNHTIPLPDSLFGAGTIAAGLKYYRIKAAASGASAMSYIDIERTFTIPAAPSAIYQGATNTTIAGIHEVATVGIGAAYPTRKVLMFYKHNVTFGAFNFEGTIGLGGPTPTTHILQDDPSHNAWLLVFSAAIPLGTTVDVFLQMTAPNADTGTLYVFTFDSALAAAAPTLNFNSAASGTTNAVNFSATAVGFMVGGIVFGDPTATRSPAISSPTGNTILANGIDAAIYVKNGLATTGTETGSAAWSSADTSIHGVIAWAPA